MHPEVSARVAHHLDAVDTALPGLIQGLYVVGSAVLEDYQPGRSDVDVLAVTTRPLGPADLDTLAALHDGFPKDPAYDGIYLTAPQVEAMPGDQGAVPHVVNGQFHRDTPCGELTPVLWATLGLYGVALRGQPLVVRPGAEALRAYCVGNLRSYWQPLGDQIRTAVAERDDDAPAKGDVVVWTVLGAPRLHYTLETGDITGKSAMVEHIVRRWPAHGVLARRVGAARRGADVTFTTADARQAADLVDAVVSSVPAPPPESGV